jgi:DNA-directed RNA polymerase specialized sigma24 family protein
MFTEGPVPMREVLTGLAGRLAQIPPWQTREFAVAAARHIRATLLEVAEQTARAAACDERLEWVRVHKGVGRLPEDDRELFDLLLYWGMREADVAALLGVSDRRVKLRWYESRLALQQAIQQEGP